MDKPLSREFKGFRQEPYVEEARSPRREVEELQRIVEELATWMDAAFEIPGLRLRFGLDALIGLIPFFGDAATTLVSVYILGLAGRAGVPKVTVARMAANVAIDMIVGSLPVVGDLFDVWWKANQKNAALLRERLMETPRQARRATIGDWAFIIAVGVGLVVLLIGIIALISFIIATAWHAAGSLFD